MRFLAEIESALDSAPSYSVEDVQQMLSSDEKGRVYQSIDNCMIALQKPSFHLRIQMERRNYLFHRMLLLRNFSLYRQQKIHLH